MYLCYKQDLAVVHDFPVDVIEEMRFYLKPNTGFALRIPLHKPCLLSDAFTTFCALPIALPVAAPVAPTKKRSLSFRDASYALQCHLHKKHGEQDYIA